MNRTLLKFGVIAVGLMLSAMPLFAHHGDAGRYEETIYSLTGTVVDLQLINPHSVIVLDVQTEDGKTVRWQAEMGGPTQLARNFGWNRNTLKPGDKITLVGRRVKSGAPYMNLTEQARVLLADGKEIFRTNNAGTGPVPPPVPGTVGLSN